MTTTTTQTTTARAIIHAFLALEPTDLPGAQIVGPFASDLSAWAIIRAYDADGDTGFGPLTVRLHAAADGWGNGITVELD